MTLFVNRCRSCNVALRWERQASGKMAPISLVTEENHFLDCPDRRQWRKKDAKGSAAAPSKLGDGARAKLAPRADGQLPLWDDGDVALSQQTEPVVS